MKELTFNSDDARDWLNIQYDRNVLSWNNKDIFLHVLIDEDGDNIWYPCQKIKVGINYVKKIILINKEDFKKIYFVSNV